MQPDKLIVTQNKKTFSIEGMHCANCAMSIDGDLEDYAKGLTEVTFEDMEVTIFAYAIPNY